ncbi:MAG: glycosyl transferase, partial [Muribaculaceae bacterium]|nr:glycosyl transferase [Muribaculaceae bacterium]
GGLYCDTDVQVVKEMEDIVARGAFMGCENPASPDGSPKDLHVAPGLGLGVAAGHPFYKELLDFYSTLKFVKEDGSLNLDTVVDYTTGLLTKHGLRNSGEIQEVAGIWIYPWDYFCPMTPTLVLNLTENSRTIHLYSASWCSPGVRFRKKVKRMLGNNVIKVIQPVVVAVRKIFKR